MNDDQRKHLDCIQAVITRMAGNSFLIRGWSVTLVSALFALAAKDADRSFINISYFPCAMFWFLDGYYLSQERLFRSLYDAARQATSTDYSMNPLPSRRPTDTWSAAALSRTMLLFHGAMLGIITFVGYMVKK